MKVNVKYLGECLHDYGLFPDELADAKLIVPDKQWKEFVDARYEFLMRYEALNNIRAKKIKA